MYDVILGFALALAVAQCAVTGWLIYETQAEKRAGRLWRSTFESVCKNLRLKCGELEKQSPMQLVVEVAELRDAVARLAKTQQRFAGRFDQQFNPSGKDSASDPPDRDALRRAHANDILPAGLKR